MRRFFWLAFLPAGLAAQRPAVSPVLPRVWSVQRVQDTTISVWLFARRGASLDAISNRATALGARVRVRSRWLHALSVDAPTAALRQLAQDRDLRRIQPLGRFRRRLSPFGLDIELLPPIAPAVAATGAEIVIVDNDSSDQDMLDYLEQLDGKQALVIRMPGPFNFSRLNNIAWYGPLSCTNVH